jgi:hypothetical protein
VGFDPACPDEGGAIPALRKAPLLSLKRKAVKPLKTNNLAKSSFGAHNDFNGLQPAMRNRSFRQAKDSFRFGGFWALSRPEPNRRQSALRESGIVIAGARRRSRPEAAGRRLIPGLLRRSLFGRASAFPRSLKVYEPRKSCAKAQLSH